MAYCTVDLYKAIRELHEELNKVNAVIAALEQIESARVLLPPRHRGRKSVAAPDRDVVSQHDRRSLSASNV
jgi:hypothetical protein